MNWIARKSGITGQLWSILAAADGKHIWAVGEAGAIVESDDGGETWKPRSSGTELKLDTIFGTSDGKRLWAADYQTFVQSDDGGATWKVHKNTNLDGIGPIIGTNDGKRLWAVGQSGIILESDSGCNRWAAVISLADSTAAQLCRTDRPRTAFQEAGKMREGLQSPAKWVRASGSQKSPTGQ